MIEKLKVLNRRKVLLVFPAYSCSFGTFEHAFRLLGVRAFMVPQGILQVAGLLPEGWEVRFLDENIRRAKAEDFEWADAVLISGMHAQRKQILEINNRAQQAGKLTVLGGPSVSAAPEFYPEVDILHCGEAGDATGRLIQWIDRDVSRPPRQVILRTSERFRLEDLPMPAYGLTKVDDYMTSSIQFSSGCPFTCEFCDIPALYGRAPRFKTPGQILAELDQLLSGGTNAIYFVDDNFVANPKATLDLLPQLIAWQRTHHYPVRFSCEATLNIARRPQMLALMREANFITVFCGVESPEPEALRQMRKTQNLRQPILQAIQTINKYGIEVSAGIILGLDTDTDQTCEAIFEFVEQTRIPLLAVNLLHALPRTPLYERLQVAGRITWDDQRDSNIVFNDPYEAVVQRWRRIVSEIYTPENVYARFAAQSAGTYSRRLQFPKKWKRLTCDNLKRAIRILARLIWKVGIWSDYRAQFWKMFLREVGRGDIEALFHIGIVAHHLILYARECESGLMSSSNYSSRQEIGLQAAVRDL